MSREAPSMTTPLMPFNFAESANKPPQQENSNLPPLSMTMMSPDLRRFDGRRAEMLRRLLQTGRLDFHRDGAPDNFWTGPLRSDTPGRAFQSQAIETIRHRAGIELGQTFRL